MKMCHAYVAAFLLVPAAIAAPGTDHRLDLSLPRFAKLSAAEKQTLAQYAAKYKSLTDLYSNVHMVVHEEVFTRTITQLGVTELGPESLSLQAEREHQYWCRDGRYFRFDTKDKMPTDPSLQGMITIITPDQWHTLGITDQPAPYVMGHGQTTHQRVTMLDAAWFRNAPFAHRQTTAMQFLNGIPEDNLTFESVTKQTSGPHELVVITAKSAGTDISGSQTVATWTLNVSQFWAIHSVEYVRDHGNGTANRTVQFCTYRQPTSDSVGPMLASVTHESFHESNGQKIATHRDTYTVKEISFSKLPLNPFDVNELRESTIKATRRRNQVDTRWFIAGNVLFVLGLVLYLRRRR